MELPTYRLLLGEAECFHAQMTQVRVQWLVKYLLTFTNFPVLNSTWNYVQNTIVKSAAAQPIYLTNINYQFDH